jgi:hypothetical protein
MKNTLLAAAAVIALALSTPALADGNLRFVISGDTFQQPFTLTNNSTGGETILSFGIDLTGTGLVFDPVDGGAPNGLPVGLTAFSERRAALPPPQRVATASTRATEQGNH